MILCIDCVLNESRKKEKEPWTGGRGFARRQSLERSSMGSLQETFQAGCDTKKLSLNLSAMPLVTVITVVLNGAQHLEQTIKSVLGQTYRNIEYIIIDGGSTDGTLDIIKKYGDSIDYWVSEPDKGIYDAMNKGIRLATGEIIGIINSDDYYLDGAIEIIVAAATREPATGIFHADLRFEKNNGMSEIWRSKENLRRSDFYHMPVNHPTVFVRSGCYKNYGLFDTKYRVAADYELIIRYLFDSRIKFRYIKETLVCMRGGGESGLYTWDTQNDVIEILSKRKFPLIIMLKFRLSYLRLMFMQYLHGIWHRKDE